MKRAKLSIKKTVEAINGIGVKVFDYTYFTRMVIAGLIDDGFRYLEKEESGDWLHCVDPVSKTWIEIDLYKEFNKLDAA